MVMAQVQSMYFCHNMSKCGSITALKKLSWFSLQPGDYIFTCESGIIGSSFFSFIKHARENQRTSPTS